MTNEAFVIFRGAFRAIALPALLALSSGCHASQPVKVGGGKGSLPSAAAVAGVHDYDFNFGVWHVENRRLVKVLEDSAEWETFKTVQVGGPLLGGLGSYDEIRNDEGAPLGLSLHLFNLQTKQWSSSFVSTRDGIMQPAVVGTFSNGMGVFEGTDTVRGKQIRVRYVWSRIATNNPRWEQAFSQDGGKTWETNWVMDYSRPERDVEL